MWNYNARGAAAGDLVVALTLLAHQCCQSMQGAFTPSGLNQLGHDDVFCDALLLLLLWFWP